MSKEESKLIFSKNLRKLMKDRHKTQSDIVHDLKIKQTTLSDWLNAISFPRINRIELLARYFNISKAELIESDPSKTKSITKISTIIDNALKSKGHNLDWLSAKTGIDKQYLEKIDDIYPTEDDYSRMSTIAQAIGTDAAELRKTLANQEPPAYEGPSIRAEDDFDDLGDRVSDADFKRAQAQLLSIGINAARVDEDTSGNKGDFVVLSLFALDPADPYGTCGPAKIMELGNVLTRIDRVLNAAKVQYQQMVKQNLYHEFMQDMAMQRAIINGENFDAEHAHIRFFKNEK